MPFSTKGKLVRFLTSLAGISLLIIIIAAIVYTSRIDSFSQVPLNENGYTASCNKAAGDVLTYCKSGEINLSARSLNVQKKLFFGDKDMNTSPDGSWNPDKNNSDPYYLEKIRHGNNASSLRLTINDDNNEALEIWGGSCAAGNCGGPGTMKHRFQADGTAEHDLGVSINRHDPGPLIQKQYGDNRGNRYGIGQFPNGQMRMYTAGAHSPATASLSIANNDGTFRDNLTTGNSGNTRVAGAMIVGDTNSRGDPSHVAPNAPVKFGLHSKNENGEWSHIPWGPDGHNYLRGGNTYVKGSMCLGMGPWDSTCLTRAELTAIKEGSMGTGGSTVNTRGGTSLNVGKDLNVQGKLFFRDKNMTTNPDWNTNSSDPYHMEKVTTGANANSLRLTINDDHNEAFEIWGGSCKAGNCSGTGTMQHRFDADGTAVHKKLQLGDKFTLSGVGDAHANDHWLRLFGTSVNGKAGNYHGGLAAGQLWTESGTLSGSDSRLKRDIAIVDQSEVDKLDQLKPVAYKLKADGPDAPTRFGFIAQDLVKVFPDMVKKGADGNLSVSYQDIIPLLVAKQQQQKEQKDKLCIGNVCLTVKELKAIKDAVKS
jgi:hypothetical protein